MKVIICDDQATVRDGLVMLLKLEPDIDIVGTAEDGAEAVEMVADRRPDLILMDLKMPVMNGVEATRQITMKYPEVKVLVLTTYADDEWVFDAIQAGASGYLLKDTPREELIRAVRGTAAGKTYIDPSIARESPRSGLQSPDPTGYVGYQQADRAGSRGSALNSQRIEQRRYC